MPQPGSGPPRLARDGTRRGIAAGSGRRAQTEPVLAKLCALLAKGRPLDTSARLAGIDPSGVRARMAAEPAFHARIEHARAQGEDWLLKKHDRLTGSNQRSQGVEWRLERLYPARWNPPKVTEVSGPGGGPQVIHHRLEAVSVQRLARGDGEE